MGKTKIIKIKRFDGGMAYDNRTAAINEYSRSLNFDIYKKPSTLIPIRGIESDQDFGGTNGIKVYDIGAFGQSFSGNTVYGWGRKTTSNTGVKLFSKSPTGAEWAAAEGLVSDVSVAVEDTAGCPVPGSKLITTFNSSGGSLMWGIVNNNDSIGSGSRMLTLISQMAGVSGSFSKKSLSSASVVSSTGIEPFLLLGQDGNVYVFDAASVHRGNASDGTVTDDVFTVGRAWRFVSACLYGSYIAIAIKGMGMSRVILWDYADSQATENIDFGEGTIVALENLNGTLVAVVDKFVNTTLNGTGSSNGQGSIQIKTWGGGADVNTVTEVKAYGVLAGATKNFHFRRNNAVYFYAKVPLDASVTESLEGVWAFGRNSDRQPWALTLYREVPSTFETFHMQGDYTYFAHGGDGSVSRTKDDDSYGLTSYWESPVMDGDDIGDEKNFKGATVQFEKLTSGQTVVLKYRKDGATSWSTLTPAPAQATGDTKAVFPMSGNFYYCEFRIESTGGAKPNGFSFRFESLNSAIE